MSLIRTFHPIGQGAFYSEKHKIQDDEFTIVYDCGSTTLKGKKLETKIKSTFPKDHVIDILFISHFHSDHINGIETLKTHCRIRKVILPLLDNESKTILKVSNFLNDGNSNTQLIDNPAQYFGNGTVVISVDEADLTENIDGINLDTSTNISTINQNQQVSSGTIFTSGIVNHDWLFIPFNYKQNIRKNQFVAQLRLEGLALDDINTIEKITTHQKKITIAYNKVDGDLNVNSLLLFSGKKVPEEMRSTFPIRSLYYYYLDQYSSNCIYFGDLDLNQPSIITDITRKLGILLQTVNTFQIPHHGSIHNFNSSFFPKRLDQLSLCAIISYGTTNTYGHPSDSVIADLVSKEISIHFVTENPLSIAVQWT